MEYLNYPSWICRLAWSSDPWSRIKLFLLHTREKWWFKFGVKISRSLILWYNYSVRLLAFHSFLNRSKLDAKRLETQWKKICDHEKRSKERNKELLKDFERVEQHAALLAVKTERLKAYKVILTSSSYFNLVSPN